MTLTVRVEASRGRNLMLTGWRGGKTQGVTPVALVAAYVSDHSSSDDGDNSFGRPPLSSRRVLTLGVSCAAGNRLREVEGRG